MGRVDTCLTLWRLVAFVRRQRTVPAAVKVAVQGWALDATAVMQGRPVSPAGRLETADAREITWSLLDALQAAGVDHSDLATFFNSHARRTVRPVDGDQLAAAIPDGYVMVSAERLEELSR